jgi:hypothetical protein
MHECNAYFGVLSIFSLTSWDVTEENFSCYITLRLESQWVIFWRIELLPSPPITHWSFYMSLVWIFLVARLGWRLGGPRELATFLIVRYIWSLNFMFKTSLNSIFYCYFVKISIETDDIGNAGVGTAPNSKKKNLPMLSIHTCWCPYGAFI